MGDSDDDYQSHNAPSGNMNTSNGNGGHNNSFNNNHKKNNNRDKFYRERDENNSNYNSRAGNDNRRDWSNGDRRGGNDSYKNNRMSGGSNQPYGGYGHSNSGGLSGGGGGYRGMSGHSEYPKKYSSPGGGGGNHNESSPPPFKRNRKDYDDSGSRSHGGSYSSPQTNYNAPNQKSHDSDYATQPPFLSFKMFLQQQEDNISDEEAIKRYNDYKMDFKKTQINNFFLEHKEEEWFKLRYHPDENFKRHNEHNQFILNRLEVFMDLMDKGWLENVSIEADKSKEITRFLDAVVIKLEGGTDHDLKILDTNEEVKVEDNDVTEVENPDKSAAKMDTNGNESIDQTAENNTENGKSQKRKADDSGSESGAYTESENDDDGEKSGEKRKKKSGSRKASEKKKPTDNKDLHKTCSIFMRNLAPSVTKQDLENLCKDYEGFKRVAISDPAPERGFFRRGWITFESHIDVKKICWNLQNTKIKDFNPGAIINRELTSRIRPVAQTHALVSHHKTVVKDDLKQAMKIIQNMDKRWNLWQENGDQLANEDPEEKEEVPKVDADKMDSESNEIANLERQAFSSIKSTEPKYLTHKFQGANPLFSNITDYLVDEVSAEEEELLGNNDNVNNSTTKATTTPQDLEIDTEIKSVLDRLVLYLRVVHSFDFYNCTEYQQEDSMPNRCGIMFARPALTATSCQITQDEISQYMKQVETKMKPYLEYKERLDLETGKKLGLKERKSEVEKFIKTNTQELAIDRWLCPLSGKKFKGPEFIRKHLFYKHMDKIQEVKKEVEYFNNYVLDPKRPQLPENTSNKPPSQEANRFAGSGGQTGYGGNQNLPGYLHGSPGMAPGGMHGQMGGYGGMQNRGMPGYGMQQGYMGDMMQQSGYGSNYSSGYNNGGYQQNRGRGGYNMGRGGGRGGRDSREMIQYRDLDAPEDN